MSATLTQTLRQVNYTLPLFPAAVGGVAAVAMFNISPVLPVLRGDLAMSGFQAGLLLTATLLAHMTVQIPGGRLLDRWGSRRLALLGMAIAGLCSVGVALAPVFLVALVARLVLGFGTGLSFLAGVVMAGEMAGEGRGATARGLYGAMFNVGTLLVLLVTPHLAGVLGWRAAFVLEAALAFALVGAGWYLVPRPPARQRARPMPWRAVLAQRRLFALGLTHVATYGTFTAVVAWAPTFLYQHYGADLALAGTLAGLLTTGGIVSRMAGGFLAAGRERGLIAICCVLTTLLVAAFPLGLSLGLTLLVLFLLSTAAGLPFGAVFQRAVQVLGPEAAGASTGLVNTVANTGALLFPALVGYLLDATASFAWGFWAVAGLAAVGLAWAIPQLYGD